MKDCNNITITADLEVLLPIAPFANLLQNFEAIGLKNFCKPFSSQVASPAPMNASVMTVMNYGTAALPQDSLELLDISFDLLRIDMDEHIKGPNKID